MATARINTDRTNTYFKVITTQIRRNQFEASVQQATIPSNQEPTHPASNAMSLPMPASQPERCTREMKLRNVSVQNFRCFSNLDIELEEHMTVLVSENGQGKSALLDAIRIVLWPYISGFDLARPAISDPGNGITISDARLIRVSDASRVEMARQLPVQITATGTFDTTRDATWTRYRDSEAKGTKTKDDGESTAVKAWSTSLQAKIRQPNQQAIGLPVFGYYGTGRLWSQKRLTEKQRGQDESGNPDFFIRTFGYVNCLDPASSYKHFREWFIWAFLSLREQQIGKLEGKGDEQALMAAKNSIKVVQQAIDAFLKPVTGWHTLEYSVTTKSLTLHHQEFGVLDVEQMSDGIRSILAMVGDIAYRCIKLNPHMGSNAIGQTCGVVMIDEIDMHLHPRWQQLILDQLQQTFKQIQFIVSTHSPQVLSTVPAKCIRVLTPEIASIDGQPAMTAKRVAQETHGMPSSDLLACVMGIDPTPDIEVARQLSLYKALIQQDLEQSDNAQQLRAILIERYGSEHPQLQEADRLIRLQKLKRRAIKSSKR